MTPRVPPTHPLHRFFAGAIEDAFYHEMGLCAPDLVEYLANLLVDFVHIQEIYSLRSATGEPLREVSEMITRAYLGPDVPQMDRDRLVHRHVGDYTLYWTGVYPEAIAQHVASRQDLTLDFLRQGKRSYAIASELSDPEDEPPAGLLWRLSENFEHCVHGLTIARKNWDDEEHHYHAKMILS